MEKERNSAFYRINIRIHPQLANKLKEKANEEALSLNFLIQDALEKRLKTNEVSLNMPDDMLYSLKLEAKKLNINLEQYILLKLL